MKLYAHVVGVGVIFLMSTGADASTHKKSEKKTQSESQKKEAALPVLNKWFALGSGCKSTPEKPGDVTVEMLPVDLATPNTFRARFSLKDFKLDTSSEKKGLASAKECSIRLNVNPPEKKRVKMISANTNLLVNKTEGAELTTYVGLKVGVAAIGSQISKYDKTTTVSHKSEDVILVPGKNPEEAFPQLQCGEAKIIGLDFTFMTKREKDTEEVKVTLGTNKTAEIVVDLEDCK